ncbi:MAG: 6-phosphofructokinase [Bacilli bacterium]|nr:6-phosphofructokinase [Mollicutes bacterium]MDY3899674.1 6-phosphofructokinase [Bacilli bacterium]
METKDPKKQIRSIGVLTSGGDAPGMNAAIRAVVRTALNFGIDVYGIYDGYRGLVEGNIVKMDRSSVTDIINRGGTILGSARLKEFASPEVTQIGIDNLRKLGIDALVTIGGDGTYHGALRMSRMGLNCIGLPGTIDNDIASTEYTIGFNTAVNTALDAIDKLRDTCNSHQRCSIVEVMGRYCGDIAFASALAGGADMVITSETGFDLPTVIDMCKKYKEENRRHIIIIITEHITDVHELAKKIEEHSGYSARATVLGHIQRGGCPTAYDRNLASRLGSAAVEELVAGKGGLCMGIFDNKVVATPIEDAFKMTKSMYAGYESLIKRLS